MGRKQSATVWQLGIQVLMMRKNSFMALNRVKKVLGIIAIGGMSFLAAPSHAVDPSSLSPAQIEQFKSLPRSQQEALAKQYGVDISMLDKLGSSANSSGKPSPEPQTILPREVDAKVTHLKQDNDYEEQDELELFGYDLFAGEPTEMAPIGDIPPPADYVLGPGDELTVEVFGKDNIRHDFVIKNDGSIHFPKLGPVNIAGQTFSQASDSIKDFVSRKVIGVETSVSVAKFKTMQVFVLGSAYKPGTYIVNSLATVTQALRAAGGIDTKGSLRDIKVKRDGKLIQQVDLYELLLNGDTSSDIRLRDGDSVYIAPRGATVAVDGEVRRRAYYELKGPTPLANVIRAAGGVAEHGFSQRIKITRRTAKGTNVIEANLASQSGGNVKVTAGDMIYVDKVPSQFKNAVALLGAVERPGAYPWRQGMRISDVIRSQSQDLMHAAQLDYAYLIRETNYRQQVEVLQFSIIDALSKPKGEADLLLQKRDQLIVLNRDIGLSLEASTKRAVETLREFQKLNNKTAENNKEQNQNTQMEISYTNPDGSKKSPEQVMLEQELAKQSQQQLAAQTLEFGQTGNVKGQEKKNIQQDTKLKISEATSASELTDQAAEIRRALLEPVIEQLKAQSTIGKPIQLVEIRGSVRFPGAYPLAKGQSLTDLIKAAGGLKESAHLARAEMTRVMDSNNQSKMMHRNYDLNDIIGEGKMPIRLQSKDRVNIFSRPEWREDYMVELEGEVMFPGKYTFDRGETIEDIIQRAGGLTEFAYPQGAIFSRESLRQLEEQKLQLLHNQLREEVSTLAFRRNSSSNPLSSASTPMEAMSIVDQLGTAEAVGRMVINLDRIIAGEKDENVLLENGDKLYIPPLRKVVSIMGHVQMPSSQIYNSNKSVEDYLASTGGPKKQADTDRIYVIRANGSVMIPNNSYWFKRGEEPLQPGDTIVVPMDTDYLDALSAWTSGTQILYQLGVAWSAIQN